MDDTTTQNTKESSQRWISAGIATTLGGIAGFLLGRWGDSEQSKRTLAGVSFAVLGATFGLLLSLFATKRQDRRSETVVPVSSLHHDTVTPVADAGPANAIAAETAALDGPLAMEPARAAAR